MPWHVVFRGHEPGVYETWQEAERQVCGFKNKLHKGGYKTYEEACLALNTYLANNPQPTVSAVTRWALLLLVTFFIVDHFVGQIHLFVLKQRSQAAAAHHRV